MKKYYWLKLKNNFFSQREIKKLRDIAGGDTYVIIYLKLLLNSLENVDKILYAETEENIVEQLSYDLDEDAQNIQVTLNFLLKNQLAEIAENQDIWMIETKELTGSESESASRVRRHRDKKKALQCNDLVTLGNKNVTTETEQDKQIEKKKETETQTQQETKNHRSSLFSVATDSNEVEMIKNALFALQVPYEIAIETLQKHSIKAIDKAISLTYQANAANAIHTKPVHYFRGVLKQIEKDGDL